MITRLWSTPARLHWLHVRGDVQRGRRRVRLRAISAGGRKSFSLRREHKPAERPRLR